MPLIRVPDVTEQVFVHVKFLGPQGYGGEEQRHKHQYVPYPAHTVIKSFIISTNPPSMGSTSRAALFSGS